MMEKNIKWVSLGLYGISFFLPVFFGDSTSGFLAFLVGLLQHPIPWFANVLYLIAIFLNRKHPTEKLICIVLAVVCASYTFTIHEVEQVGSESEPSKVSVGWGFFFWYGSFIVLLISMLYFRYVKQKMPDHKPPPI